MKYEISDSERADLRCAAQIHYLNNVERAKFWKEASAEEKNVERANEFAEWAKLAKMEADRFIKLAEKFRYK